MVTQSILGEITHTYAKSVKTNDEISMKLTSCSKIQRWARPALTSAQRGQWPELSTKTSAYSMRVSRALTAHGAVLSVRVSNASIRTKSHRHICSPGTPVTLYALLPVCPDDEQRTDQYD